ncbi:MAG TPA: nuclear transport factor 2 family protein [Pyrinomonadaceae bacterium]
MKLRMIIPCLIVAFVVLIWGCQAGGTNQAADATANTNANAGASTKSDSTAAAKPTVDQIREVLAAHDKALNDKNLDALMSTFSTDPTTVVLGTGVEERWMGPDEIKAAYTEMFKDYDAGTLDTKCDAWKTGGSDGAGTMAWLAASCDCKDSLKGKARAYKLNVSATVEKQDGKWRFVALHMSNAFQPPVSK